jgi:hypothetical protein
MNTNEFNKIRKEILDEKIFEEGAFQGSLFFIGFSVFVIFAFLISTDAHYEQLQVVGVGFLTLVIDIVGLHYLIDHPIGRIPIVTDEEVKKEIENRITKNNELLEKASCENLILTNI